MKTKLILRIFCLISIVGLVLLGGGERAASAPASPPSAPLAIIQIEPEQITWQPLVEYASLKLTVATPGGGLLRRTFLPDSQPTLRLADEDGSPLPDGSYTYELRLTPVLDAETRAALVSAADDTQARLRVVDELRVTGKIPAVTSLSGAFAIQGGRFVLPQTEETGVKTTAPASPGTIESPNLLQPLDVVYPDDVIIQGSLCVGFDCIVNESFGFDTIKLKENNLRLNFEDTSVGTFPTNDWQIIANDSTSGGASYLAIQDSTGGKLPFRVMAGARTHALFVDGSGRIGFGTSTPGLNLHIVSGETPAVRLDQDGSGGYTAQVWDMAGNETNFFIRDNTAGSKQPFRILTGSPTDSLVIKSDGKVGLGASTPAYALEIEKTGENAAVAADRTDGATAILSAETDKVRIGSVTNHNVVMVVNNTPVMTVTAQGNITMAGALSEFSDVNVKENITPVNGKAVLARLNQLPIMTWNYKADQADVPHLGPMAQDFYAAFGLGVDDRHIAALDANGVSLVAIQALTDITNQQQARLDRLEQENISLKRQLVLLYAGLLGLALLALGWRVWRPFSSGFIPDRM